MPAGIAHLHTYFLFPFSLDKQALIEDHADVWSKYQHWIDGLDEWIATDLPKGATPLVDELGCWKRAAYSLFDADSAAYQDMVFFHPIVRRVFFDVLEPGAEESESLLRCYSIATTGRDCKVVLEAEDNKGRYGWVEVTDLRLFLFANGIGVLSIGVEAVNLLASKALWINEAMRKLYPSSGRQMREGRTPSRVALLVDRNGERTTLLEERFENLSMRAMQPPISKVITGLLYFASYPEQEYEPVLDERMMVYTYFAVNRETVAEDFVGSEEYNVLFSRFLYVDRAGSDYRYDRHFTKDLMQQQMYMRWAHEGTYYGFTSYSTVTSTMGVFDCDEHLVREGFLIHRMFDTRYYLMALVALFYRAALLDYAVRVALVSKQLYLDQEDGRLSLENIQLSNDLRAEFLHFSNYWYFSELANKDEEVEHFAMMCRELRVDAIKRETEEELDKLNDALHSYHQFRNTEAVNRLAMLSLLFGAGAVLTGFFGMNFGKEFSRVFFEPDAKTEVFHQVSIVAVALLAFGALAFGFWVVVTNWADYRDILTRARQSARLEKRRK